MLIFSRRSSAAGRQPDKLLSMGFVRLRPYTLRNRSVRCVTPRCGKKRTRQNRRHRTTSVNQCLDYSRTVSGES